MLHLSTERLASLVDESPTPAELVHLTGCAECTRERAMFRSLADLAASESKRIGSPLTSWESLAPALLADGVIDDGRIVRLGSRRGSRPWLQAAAAVLFIAGGMMAGRYTAGASPLPINVGSQPTTSFIDTTSRFTSVAEARQAQAQSQALYETATAFLAQQDTTSRSADSPTAIRTRLAAIEQTQDVMGEALKKAPYDAVINGYYLSTLGQREATLRQLNEVMPASMKITSY
jgi:hypothetical protein